MRQLHEMLFYLTEALRWHAAAPVRGELAAARDEIVGLAQADAAELRALDVPELRSRVGELLSRTSELLRAQDSRVGKRPLSRRRQGSRRGKAPRLQRGADLIGVDLRTADLVGADLRGALLIAADLRGTDLSRADLLGADLRDADLRGADLSRGLFITQPQVNAARGDARTSIPSSLTRPSSWAPSAQNCPGE